MRVVAYTYEADVHCPACTYQRFGRHILPQYQQDECPELCDEHGIVLDATDSDSNPVRPVFSTDEHDFTHCGDCREELL